MELVFKSKRQEKDTKDILLYIGQFEQINGICQNAFGHILITLGEKLTSDAKSNTIELYGNSNVIYNKDYNKITVI